MALLSESTKTSRRRRLFFALKDLLVAALPFFQK